MSRMPEVVPAFSDSPTLALTGRTRLESTQSLGSKPKSAVKLLSNASKHLKSPIWLPKGQIALQNRQIKGPFGF